MNEHPTQVSGHAQRGQDRFVIAVLVGFFVLAYLVFPVLAGACELGNQDGPRIYPPAYHRTLYMMGWVAFGKRNKVHPGLPTGQEGRPWFYGY